MKTQYLYKYVLTFILMMMGAQQLQAQDAFYIYRNDGDFDGFFYDEVVRMGYSKTDLEGEEHDVYVIQEIETADSLYRIPLATIDSIGFQQPEIRINPRLKIISQSGLLPYIQQGNGEGARFYKIPNDLKPQVGDVLVGLPTDENAEEMYEDGSFGLVVEKTETDQWDSDYYYVFGRPVEQISDIFDQYITVEQIGIDNAGNVRRRVAGCGPDGMPRRASGGGEACLIDFKSTLTRSWKISDNSSAALSAEVGLKYILRAAYDISWTRFFVKLTHDVIIRTKPSLNLSVSKDFEYNIGDLSPIKSIMFPAACPIFKTDPIPEVFVRGGGTLQAALNLPEVELGIGEEMIFDSNRLFPIGYSLHLVPSDGNITDDMLDFSSKISLSGFIQTGVKLSANVGTANWFKKILMGDIGVFLYCGPKLEGEMQYSLDLLNEENGESTLLDAINGSTIRSTLLSLDLEAKAKAAAFWKDPEEQTFFSKNWSFLCDTLRFFPRFEKTIVEVDKDMLKIKIQIKKDKVTGPYITIKAGIFEEFGREPIMTDGDWTYSSDRSADYYTTTVPLSRFRAARYYVAPIVRWGRFATFTIWDAYTDFVPPYEFEIEPKEYIVPAVNPSDPNAPIEMSITFSTNCPKEDVGVVFDSDLIEPIGDLEVVDEKEKKYKCTFKVQPNQTLFDLDFQGTVILGGSVAERTERNFTVKQEMRDISQLKKIEISSAPCWWIFETGIVASRKDNNTIVVKAQYENVTEKKDTWDNYDGYFSEKAEAEFTIKKHPTKNNGSYSIFEEVGYATVNNGKMKRLQEDYNKDGKKQWQDVREVTFSNVPVYNLSQANGPITKGSWKYNTYYTDENVSKSEEYGNDSNVLIIFAF